MELTRSAKFIMSHDDMADILTEEICKNYGILSELRVTLIEQNDSGGFAISLNPKPKEETE